MWDDALRVAKFHGGQSAHKRVAYAWALALGGDAGAKLLNKQVNRTGNTLVRRYHHIQSCSTSSTVVVLLCSYFIVGRPPILALYFSSYIYCCTAINSAMFRCFLFLLVVSRFSRLLVFLYFHFFAKKLLVDVVMLLSKRCKPSWKV